MAAVTAGGPAASDRGLARLVAADFYPALKGAADVVVAGDRNGTADRYFLRLSDASYDRQTASVDFKAEMRSARDPPLLKNGAVAATQTGTDKDKILKVLTPTGRPISLNNVWSSPTPGRPRAWARACFPPGRPAPLGSALGGAARSRRKEKERGEKKTEERKKKTFFFHVVLRLSFFSHHFLEVFKQENRKHCALYVEKSALVSE